MLNRPNRNFISQEYRDYLEQEEEEEAPTHYEKICHLFGDYIQLDLEGELIEKLKKDIRVARLNLTPQEILSTAIFVLVVMIGILTPLSLVLFAPLSYFIWAFPIFWTYYSFTYPNFKAEVVRIQSSDESLRAILYMAMYLDMNPNLEGAIKTAASHIKGPLSKDMSKLLWDVEMGRYVSVKRALGDYMKLWRDWSQDFVKSIEFLVNSIERTGEERRKLIKKAQDNIIENTFDRMKQYSRNLQGPLKIIHMMGIVLPIMGLIMFPLVSIFLHGKINPLYVVAGYTVVLPLVLFFVIKRQISKRPGAYTHPSLKNVRDLPPKNMFRLELGESTYYIPLLPLSLLTAFVIMVPGLIHYFTLLNGYISYAGNNPEMFKQFMTNLYNSEVLISNMIQAFTVYWGSNVGLTIFYLGRSWKRKKIRDMIEQIESDLDLGLTELQNSLSQNIPIERALYDVIDEYEKIGEEESPMRDFFVGVLNRIQELGLVFKEAVFSPSQGVIKDYPSSILRNVMRVISNSIMKGSQVLVSNIGTVQEYIQNNERIEKKIKGLLDEVLSSMRMLAVFIAPLMCSMAASIGTMILKMLYEISKALQEIEESFGISTGIVKAHEGMNAGPLAKLTQFEQIMPPTLTMIIVGTYLIEVIFILSYFINGVEHGFDEINRDITLGKYLIITSIIFSGLVLGAIWLFLPFITKLGTMSSAA